MQNFKSIGANQGDSAVGLATPDETTAVDPATTGRNWDVAHHALPHVWIGPSAENQRSFDTRWPHVREIPATVRFRSYEPLLGPLVLPADALAQLHWLVCAGETTPQKEHGRKMDPAWARDVRDQCKKQKIGFFFKLWATDFPRLKEHNSGLEKPPHTTGKMPTDSMEFLGSNFPTTKNERTYIR